MRSKGLTTPRDYFNFAALEMSIFYFQKCFPGFPRDTNSPFTLYRLVRKEVIKKKLLKIKK